MEKIEKKTAFSRKMCCPKCGSRKYEIVESIVHDNKYNGDNWFVRCSSCGCEGLPSPARDIAILRWRQL